MEILNHTVQFAKSKSRILFIDILVFAFILVIPAISHLVPFPLYLMEPMRVGLLIGYFLSRNVYNGLFLAITIPLFSTISTGHPLLLKSILISLELSVNMAFFYFLFFKLRWGLLSSILISIVSSKLVYYAIKYLFLEIGWLQGNLVSTGLQSQALALAAISLGIWLFFRSKHKHT